MSRANEEKFLDTESLSEILKIKPGTLRGWRSLGCGPPWYTLGRLIRYRMTDVEKWIEKRKREGKTIRLSVFELDKRNHNDRRMDKDTTRYPKGSRKS
jgi:hypothetical protein